jgi:hypothetical protein
MLPAPVTTPSADQQRDPGAGEELALPGVGRVVTLRPAGQQSLAQLPQPVAEFHAAPSRCQTSLTSVKDTIQGHERNP